MSTTSMNISLPEELKNKVVEIVEQGYFSTPSDYVRQLIREDLENKLEKELRLKELIIEGLNSPISDKTTEQIFAEIRERIKNKKI